MTNIYKIYLFIIISVLLMIQLLMGQDKLNSTLIGQWADGPCQVSYVDGTHLYFGDGGNLIIADISDPNNPVELGKITLPSLVRDVLISGNYAYVAVLYEGLRIIDISDPYNPNEVGFLETPDKSAGVAKNNNLVYLANGEGGLRIIDVADPVNPSEIGFYDTPGFALDVKLKEDTAYVADSYEGLRIIDCSDPANPTEIGFYDTQKAHGLDLDGDYAYIADGTDGLLTLNISNPSSPDSVNLIYTNGEAHDVAINGNTAYVAAYTGGLRIIDVSDPANTAELGNYNVSGYAFKVFAKDSMAYVAWTADGLRIIDCSNPNSPNESASIDTRNFSSGVAIDNNYAYVANHSDGLIIIDISDSANPNETGYYNTPGIARGIDIDGNFAYVADDYSGLRIIDITNPTNVSETGSFDTPGDAFDVVVSENYAYVADRYSGLRIIDVNDPANPTESGFFDTGNQAFSVAVSGTMAYVADGEAGLRLIDIIDPVNPSETGFFDTGGTAYGIAVRDSLAYVADGSEGLRIINVSDPANPAETGFFNTGDVARDVSLNGKYVYVSDRTSGLRIIDVSDPLSPIEVGYYDTGVEAIGVADSTDLVYIADGDDGLYIIRNDIYESSATITVLTPNGGENWEVGSQNDITWNSENTSGTVNIEYSTDDGLNWTPISSDEPDDGSYTWTIPNSPSSNCKVRVSDTDNNPSDESDNVFTIYQQTGIIWQTLLSVSDANNNSNDLTFGTASDATDGYDSDYDQYAPPKPPSGSFDSRFTKDNEDYIKDFRGPIESQLNHEIIWNIEFQYSSGGDPISLNWDNNTLPEDGYFRLVDNINSPNEVDINMHTQNSYTVSNTSIDELFIIFKLTTTFEMHLLTDWNMIGLPLEVEDSHYQTLFPNAIENTLYSWVGYYQLDDSLEIGEGYWLRNSVEEDVIIEGTEFNSVTLDLMEGWNMIAGPSGDVALANVDDPGNIIIENTLYDWAGYYVLADTIKQGHGYWIRTNAAGQITISLDSQSTTSLAKNEVDLDDYPSISVTDAGGKSRTLFLQIETDENTDMRSFSLPPVAPGNAFDVRFTGDTYVSTSDEAEIDLQSEDYPLSISINGLQAEKGYQYVLKAYKDGTEMASFEFGDVKSVQLDAAGSDRLSLNKEKIIPKVFALYQNYPNPFNPTTEIRYDIPGNEQVRLEIYNTLGQKVRTLISGMQEAGMHKVQWDGCNNAGIKLSSGIYVYALSAGKHHAVKKMILIK